MLDSSLIAPAEFADGHALLRVLELNLQPSFAATAFGKMMLEKEAVASCCASPDAAEISCRDRVFDSK